MPDSPFFGLADRPRGSRFPSFVLSLGLHAVGIGLLIAARSAGVAESTEDPRQAANREHKVIWYTPAARLPVVAPVEAVGDHASRARQFRPLQQIAATAENAESRRQMVLQSPPQLRLARDIHSPNVLFFNPAVAPPPAPKPRFTLPRPAPVHLQALPDLETPRVSAAAPPVSVQPPRVSAPRFQMPPRPEPRPEAKPLTATAPQITVPLTSVEAIARVQPKLVVERPRFVLPQEAAGRRSPEKRVLASAAPSVAVPATKDDAVARLESRAVSDVPGYEPRRFRLPEKTTPVPERRALAAGVGGPDAPPVTGPPVVGPAVAIVGLDPIRPELAEAPPPGNRSANFSAGPNTKDEASPTLSASAKAEVRVPNLAIAPAPGASPSPVAGAAQSAIPSSTGRSAFRQRLLALAAARPATPRAAMLMDAPLAGSQLLGAEPLPPGMLHGSSVYNLAIDMPNITSYDGSWTLRFSEVGGSSPDDFLTAPIAMHKVDPKYSAAAAAEGVEGKVLLYAVIRRDGRVDQVRLVQGVDERLDSSAVSAFSKWEFQPATKNGEPVDLEAVVQIPFRAGPRQRK